jgi:hypothetical protein
MMPPNGEAAPELPAYSEDGVDLTLIRWMLSMTPEERLQAVQECANSIRQIREMNADD